MTPRERWLALFAGERPDRIPTDYWATDEVTARLLKDLHCNDVEELYCKLHIDGLIIINAPRIRDHHPDDPDADIWGIRKKVMEYGSGSYNEFGNHPLESAQTVDDIDAFAWPTAENHDFEAYRTLIQNAPRHRIIRSGEFEPFLIYCAMRGMEQAMMDLLVEPDIAMAALNHIFDYYYELNQRTYEIGKGLIDVTYVAEDLGSQTQLLLSVPLIRKFILPNQKRMADLARSYGIHIFYHTDGSARDILPDLINVTGIELLNPIQWRCPGMEREALVRDFGDKIIFHGAMDNQQTLPFGTTDDVRAEVLDNIAVFSGARWICAPCHNIQPVTPTANIVTMYETIHQHGTLS
ncbi:MAG: uroporphyrinogen-III decarboxylase-like protein [Ignavibacteriae bacterium]|nr:uroporphyrinogen-III decarboxylase-like protein [Ignavibacteriota bacterium]